MSSNRFAPIMIGTRSTFRYNFSIVAVMKSLIFIYCLLETIIHRSESGKNAAIFLSDWAIDLSLHGFGFNENDNAETPNHAQSSTLNGNFSVS